MLDKPNAKTFTEHKDTILVETEYGNTAEAQYKCAIISILMAILEVSIEIRDKE